MVSSPVQGCRSCAKSSVRPMPVCPLKSPSSMSHRRQSFCCILSLQLLLSKTRESEGRQARSHLSLTAPRLRTLPHGSRCILDRLSSFLSQDIDSVLKRSAKICQQCFIKQMPGPFVTEFALNLACKAATLMQLPQPPSQSHLGCQSHQTLCARTSQSGHLIQTNTGHNLTNAKQSHTLP